ncbi:MAG: hypothetical protein ACJ790_05295 [Myxococcaceae bacterium]
MSIKTKAAIDAAFVKGYAVTGNKPGDFFRQWPINKREFQAIEKAAKSDDGKISREEAQYISYQSRMTYKTLTKGAMTELKSLERSRFIDPNDLFEATPTKP